MMSSRILATEFFGPSVDKICLEYLKENKQRLLTTFPPRSLFFLHLETSPAKVSVFQRAERSGNTVIASEIYAGKEKGKFRFSQFLFPENLNIFIFFCFYPLLLPPLLPTPHIPSHFFRLMKTTWQPKYISVRELKHIPNAGRLGLPLYHTRLRLVYTAY